MAVAIAFRLTVRGVEVIVENGEAFLQGIGGDLRHLWRESSRRFQTLPDFEGCFQILAHCLFDEALHFGIVGRVE